MVRKPRLWVPESFYHIVCRGNRRDALFKDIGDFKVFLHMLQEVNEQAPFELATYCLMTNHFHLQLRSQVQPVSKVMSLLNKRYADYYNTKNSITGHVFEKRYFDKIIYSNEDMLEISRYIHLNPLKAGMVKTPESYRWSSYRYYLYTKKSALLNSDVILDSFSGSVTEKREKYRMYLNEEIEKGQHLV
ncbi:REP-associated tyrosine transposase [Virgibacillus salinus]|uniref:REP element-mobilizing transposase RayT n=1 Tax=Virgibacillus salinus TaxID=553311 RepID=A0A1H0YYT9_9BACI|nr:transposase [Virgibacillus salinus]SDQ20304.1 REP element-mobilizing transposase RayT [Virgibacillus salinus]